ncbi:MAG: hypothetical protein Q8Q78_05550 [Hydrogenophaga sp.]|nr:hypothetical protein [Hydrogenophaga sp.]
MPSLKGPALGALLLTLTAYSGGTSSDSTGTPSATLAEQIKALEDSGQLPRLDRSSDIKGPDADNNGIRDDIDAWITAQPITDAQKKAAQQMARVQQAKILVDLSDKSALQMLGNQSMRGVSCLVDVFKPEFQKSSDLRGHLEAMMANTKERAKQYLAYNRAVSGSSGRLPKGNTCEP